MILNHAVILDKVKKTTLQERHSVWSDAIYGRSVLSRGEFYWILYSISVVISYHAIVSAKTAKPGGARRVVPLWRLQPDIRIISFCPERDSLKAKALHLDY